MPDPHPAIADPDAPDDLPLAPPPRHRHVQKPKEAERIHPEGDDGGKDAKQGEDKGDKEDKKDKEDEKPKTPIYKRPGFWIAIAVLLVGAIVAFFYWLHARDYQSTDDAFIEGHVVQISPQVSARVLKVYIDDNTKVAAGDPLLDLDPIDYQVALSQAKGNEAAALGKLEQAKASVENSRSMRDEAKANLDAANVSFENSDRDLKRYEALDDRARSKQQYDNAITAQKNAAASVNQSKARLASAESQITVAIANVAAAQGQYETSVADRKRAEVNLGYCHVVAPRDGRVTTKNVEPGMYATVGTPLFSIVEPEVWVIANFKETQLTDMRIGQAVALEIDAYPDKKFDGRIESVQAGSGARFSVLPAENATGNFVKIVQRIPVKITFNEGQTKDPEHLLSPGMSVVPYVKIR